MSNPEVDGGRHERGPAAQNLRRRVADEHDIDERDVKIIYRPGESEEDSSELVARCDDGE